MPVTINDLTELVAVDDGDFLPIWDTGAGSNNSKKISRANLLDGVVLEEGDHTLGDIDADVLNAPVGAIDALTVATSLTLGATITKILKGSLSLVVGNITTDSSADVTATLTGAASGDVILFSIDAPAAGLVFAAWVSSANTVTFRVSNPTGGTINGATYTARTIAIRAS
jgi:hypothetical protein